MALAEGSRTRRALDAYLRFARRSLGGPAARISRSDARLRRHLEEAHIAMLPDTFIALAILDSALFCATLYVASAAVIALSTALGDPPNVMGWVVVVFGPPIAGALLYLGHSVYPEYRASERRRAIDLELPYAVNYIAAMSTAGLVPADIFRDLARQPIYGEVSREMAWISRDIDLLGVDFVGAMNAGIARSPSVRFQEFLQGAKTTLLTGGELREYFGAKADQYMGENRALTHEFLNGLGIMSESYVTVVIAGPLFMLVLLSIMVVIGRGSQSSEAFLFVLVFAALPLAHIAFSWGVKAVGGEAN